MDDLLKNYEPAIDQLFERCAENAPNFGVRAECFKASVTKTAQKYLFANSSEPPSDEDLKQFFEQLQADDLLMALACSNGNERAWWEFDQQHRAYLERVAGHLAKFAVMKHHNAIAFLDRRKAMSDHK